MALNKNGKVDRKKLNHLYIGASEEQSVILPTTATEKNFAKYGKKYFAKRVLVLPKTTIL